MVSSKKVIIYGITDLAELLYGYLQSDKNYDVVGFCVDDEFIPKSGCFCNKNVYCFSKIIEIFDPKKYCFFVCVGYTNMNQYRKIIFNKLKKQGYSILSYIHPTSIILTDDIGEGNLVFPNVFIDSFTRIGNGNIFYAGAHLSHHSIVDNFNFFAVKACVCGHVVVKSNCFIGANSTIKNGVTLNSFTLVGAGAYIKTNTESYGIYVPQNTSKIKEKRSTELTV